MSVPGAQQVALMNWQGYQGTGFRAKDVRCKSLGEWYKVFESFFIS